MQHFERPSVRELAIYQVRYLLIFFSLLIWCGLIFILTGVLVRHFVQETGFLIAAITLQTTFLLIISYFFGIKNYRSIISYGAILICSATAIARWTRLIQMEGDSYSDLLLSRFLECTAFDLVLILIIIAVYNLEKMIPQRNTVFNKALNLRHSKYLIYGYLGFSTLATTTLIGSCSIFLTLDSLDSNKELENKVSILESEKVLSKTETFILKHCRSPNKEERSEIDRTAQIEARNELSSAKFKNE
jgi:hypothetical protein